MPSVSEHYRKLEPEQVEVMASVYADAWQHPEIPERQYAACVQKELEDYRLFKPNAPFDALGILFNRIPELNKAETRLLDVGASSGYYKEVLGLLNFACQYVAVDYSVYFQGFAQTTFPGIQFHLGSATELPFEDKSFDVILHGACIMHLQEYEKAIEEAARVAKEYVIFHRTPIFLDDTPTQVFVKTAYGVPCVEFHFNEIDLLHLFSKYSLGIVTSTDVFTTGHFAHRSYLLKVDADKQWERA